MMFAIWRRRLRDLTGSTRQKRHVNRNDRRIDQPCLAIHVVRGSGMASDYRLPQEPGSSSPLAVVQCVVQIPHSVLVADGPRQPVGVGAGWTMCLSARKSKATPISTNFLPLTTPR